MTVRRSFASILALGVLAAASSSAPSASAAQLGGSGATLLDQPPRLFNFKLDDPSTSGLALLRSFHEADVEHPGSTRQYLSGAWSRWNAQPRWKLAWASSVGGLAPDSASESAPRDDGLFVDSESRFGFGTPESDVAGRVLDLAPDPAPSWIQGLLSPAFATTGRTFASNGFDALWSLPPSKPVPNWRCRRRPVRFVRYGAETDAFALVRCDGAVAPQALDRLTFMARVPDAKRPGELLPDEPDPSAGKGEWLPGVRVVNPRLLWALQRVADAFPWRTIYIFSGYRPAPKGARPGGHHSLHGEARAMDISVSGVPNESLFAVCHKLDDIGCGFYPNSKFVHVDIRRPGTGHAYWIDISSPGEPSHFVDGWPGVVEGGALSWDPAGRDAAAAPGATDANCTRRTDGR
ncbi:MAG: D-Ala-D-Ala carboxypeptidase family metallohydrolase [Byssovorax sp.]